MKRQEIIEQICEVNRSAKAAFLDRFDDRALTEYLGRLTRLHGHRGKQSVWVRRGITPASTARIAA